jgi:hypothetical protein
MATATTGTAARPFGAAASPTSPPTLPSRPSLFLPAEAHRAVAVVIAEAHHTAMVHELAARGGGDSGGDSGGGSGGGGAGGVVSQLTDWRKGGWDRVWLEPEQMDFTEVRRNMCGVCWCCMGRLM